MLRTTALLLLAACSPKVEPQAPDTPLPTREKVFAETCDDKHPTIEPDLMGWDAPKRANLNRLRHEGIVAVHYESKGCDVQLEALPQCIAKGSYAFSPYSAVESMTATNARELHAALPLGAASLEGKLANDRALRADRRIVGMVAVPATSSFADGDLNGPDCARATHVVSAVYLGAFALEAGDKRSIAAATSFFGTSAGGSTASTAERLEAEGTPEACDLGLAELKEHPLCAVPLRVSLVPIRKAALGIHPDLDAITEITRTTATARDLVNVLRGRVEGLGKHLATCKELTGPRESFEKNLAEARTSLAKHDADLAKILADARTTTDAKSLDPRVKALGDQVKETETKLKYTSISIVLCKR